VIRRLEADGPTISTVVLADVVGSVIRAELAEFLAEAYPFLRVIRHGDASGNGSLASDRERLHVTV